MKQSLVFSYKNHTLYPIHTSIVSEFPIQLLVNGREIATLIGSPYNLRFLIAGFLRLQGFVTSLDDFEMFSVCEEFGIANIRLKKELPQKLKPVLTSGCGTGVTFSLPTTENLSSMTHTSNNEIHFYQPQELFAQMDELAKRADNYKNHGGIHSAAIGRNGKIILYAEDLGRHNTFDRIAGEALFKGIPLENSVLLTSGRVSTEMVAKAALMGVRLIASRTSPTDMAVKLCEQAGICLIGYMRGGTFSVYAHPEMIDYTTEADKIDGVTGVILAGGTSTRMGTNKALLKVDGVCLIEGIYRKLKILFKEVLIVTNTPGIYDFLPCKKVPDLYPGIGSIAGLHSGLFNSSSNCVFITACDMPNIDIELIRQLYKNHGNQNATIPFSQGGQEPLHAFYSRNCLPIFTTAIENGERKILECIEKIDAKLISWETIQTFQGAEKSFLNVNTPDEFSKIKV